MHLICSRTVWESNPDKCGEEVALVGVQHWSGQQVKDVALHRGQQQRGMAAEPGHTERLLNLCPSPRGHRGVRDGRRKCGS